MSVHLSAVRRLLYREASLLGDVNAWQKHRLPQRLVRRLAYREANKALRKLLKSIGV